jgi:DNA-binding transcriptional LysR family regulator
MRPILARYDEALGEVRRLARGESAQLRIGYLGSISQDYLSIGLLPARKSRWPNSAQSVLSAPPKASFRGAPDGSPGSAAGAAGFDRSLFRNPTAWPRPSSW